MVRFCFILKALYDAHTSSAVNSCRFSSVNSGLPSIGLNIGQLYFLMLDLSCTIGKSQLYVKDIWIYQAIYTHYFLSNCVCSLVTFMSPISRSQKLPDVVQLGNSSGIVSVHVIRYASNLKCWVHFRAKSHPGIGSTHSVRFCWQARRRGAMRQGTPKVIVITIPGFAP